MKYQTGFGNEFATEAVNGALPVGRRGVEGVAGGAGEVAQARAREGGVVRAV